MNTVRNETPCAPVKSVYEDSSVANSATDGIFVYQSEKVSIGRDCVDMEVVYTASGNYVGDRKNAETLIQLGIVENIAPATKDGVVCSIGFNPSEQKWYGWSHRALNGFGIGSVVTFGDCAFSPSDKQEFEDSAKHFWEIGERITASGEKCVTEVVEIIHDTTHEDHGDNLGMLFRWSSTLEGKASLGSYHFYEYPEVWGRGAWAATTLEDAKQMAIDFAYGVS